MKIKTVLILSIILLLLSANLVLAESVIEKQTEQEAAFLTMSGIRGASVGEIASAVIKGFLGLLGIIFIILMVYAGYLWMTAAGNEDDVKKAKDLIEAAVIGLIIIVAAYSITHFVFNALSKTGASGKPEIGGSS